ncbi:MAG: zinc-binding alcohol dehydrogenase family protein [Variovorax sp.]|nr:zinc-binding alcohol dehydrogenase family protein [Variovorax sp.]
MKAVAYLQPGGIDREDALLDLELPLPQPGPGDLRVRVAAVSVNPVDTKIRKSRVPQPDQPEVLGWDAVGTVDAVGAQVQGFTVGDRVFYAGAIDRPGTNAEYHLVDARIVGRAPARLSDAEAAALPLTAITAWELLFDRLGVPAGGGDGAALLVIGGAGGVGSVLIQLARQLTRLTVIVTASRPETQAWCRELGAHHVIDHAQPLAPQLAAIDWPQVPLVASLTQSDEHWSAIVEAAMPQGRIALIDDPVRPLDVMSLKRKSLSLHWELMFTRSLYQTSDMAAQGKLLDAVAAMVEDGRLRTTVTQTLRPINADMVRRAHALIESGRARGKVTIEGWG